MRFTLLGSGDAAGMPLYGCQCHYCKKVQGEPKRHRTPCSAVLQIDQKKYLIDAGQVNLHQRFPAGSIDGIFLTHFHPDHVQGLFHLRWGTNLSIPVFAPPDPEGCADLFKHPGILNFKRVNPFSSFDVAGLQVTPVPLIHSKPTVGYLFEYKKRRVAYLSDTKGLPEDTLLFLDEKSLDQMIIDCSFPPQKGSGNHNNLDDVYRIVELIKPNQVVLTHIGHDLDIWLHNHFQELPCNWLIGQDGMKTFSI